MIAGGRGGGARPRGFDGFHGFEVVTVSSEETMLRHVLEPRGGVLVFAVLGLLLCAPLFVRPRTARDRAR